VQGASTSAQAAWTLLVAAVRTSVHPNVLTMRGVRGSISASCDVLVESAISTRFGSAGFSCTKCTRSLSTADVTGTVAAADQMNTW